MALLVSYTSYVIIFKTKLSEKPWFLAKLQKKYIPGLILKFILWKNDDVSRFVIQGEYLAIYQEFKSWNSDVCIKVDFEVPVRHFVYPDRETRL